MLSESSESVVDLFHSVPLPGVPPGHGSRLGWIRLVEVGSLLAARRINGRGGESPRRGRLEMHQLLVEILISVNSSHRHRESCQVYRESTCACSAEVAGGLAEVARTPDAK